MTHDNFNQKQSFSVEAKISYSNMIKAEALRLGFSACGIAPAEEINAENKMFLFSLNQPELILKQFSANQTMALPVSIPHR